MKLEEFDYNLPKELIAQYPPKLRGASKLLVIERKTNRIYHGEFPNIIDYLEAADTMVLNDTKVIPARLFGFRKKTGGRIEIFLLERLGDNIYKVLLRPGKKINVSERIIIEGINLFAQITKKNEGGFGILEFESRKNLQRLLEKYGEIPLPPYIKRKPQALDEERYQTVYAKKEGAVAAPTAGLHFTKGLLSQILKKGINICYVTLHINYATFNPVKEKIIEDHKMYQEYYEFSPETARVIKETRKKNKKILAVGTTSSRVLETVAKKSIVHSPHSREKDIQYKAMHGWTDLFIYPPYEFKLTDMLLTNFHFPKSTLLMLIAAFCGTDIWKKAYQEAIQRRYRFYSYGDAMLIV